MNVGIGDSDALITDENVGVLIHNFGRQDYARAVVEIEGFASDAGQTRRRAREVAAKLFDLRRVGIERYTRLYERLVERVQSSPEISNVQQTTLGNSDLT